VLWAAPKVSDVEKALRRGIVVGVKQGPPGGSDHQILGIGASPTKLLTELNRFVAAKKVVPPRSKKRVDTAARVFIKLEVLPPMRVEKARSKVRLADSRRPTEKEDSGHSLHLILAVPALNARSSLAPGYISPCSPR